MPLPKPGDMEAQSDFMDRCMGDETMNNDFPDNKQRAAVCHQQWRDRNKAMFQSKAYSILNVKSVSETERLIEGIASTPTPDRVKDVVEPLGAKFKLPMPLLWQHDAGQPVGNVEFAKPTKDGIPFKARIAKIDEPGELKSLVDKAWQAVKAKLVRGVSIGFKILDHEIMKSGGWRIKQWEWLELSLVTIPANAEATIQTIKSFDARSLAAIGRKRSASILLPGASGPNPKGSVLMQSLVERIAATSEDVKALAERMNALMEKEDAEGGLEKAERDEIDEIEKDIKTANEKLRRLKSLQAASENAVPVNGDDPPRAAASRAAAPIRPTVPAEAKRHDEIGTGWVQKVRCQLLPRMDGQFIGMNPMAIAKQLYPGHTQLLMELKADVAGGTTTDAAWAEPLVTPTVLASEFIEYLRALTIVGRFGTGGIPSLRRIPFNVKIQEQTAAGDGYWVGEGAAKPLTEYAFTSTTHRWCKVANIAVLSEDLIRFSNPAADVLIRNLLAESLQAKLDTEFITASTAAVLNVSPGSILNGSANTAASTAVTAAQVMDDLKTLLGYFSTANNPLTSGVFIMRQTAATALSLMVNSVTGVRDFPNVTPTGGTLIGFPVIVSQYVPTGIVALVNASDIYLSDDGGVNVAMSREASLEMSTAPAQSISDGSPTAPVAATQKVVSMFQTNSVAIRCERMINWSRRRASAVAYLTSVGWGNTGSSPDGAPI